MKIENLSVAYGENLIIDKFNIEFREGETTCIFGASGVGKTTLLNAIANIVQYDGSIEKYENISYDFQNDRLLKNLSVEDNIKYVCGKEADTERVLELVELQDKAKKKPKELSGGEKQRVAFARSILAKYDVLILDEPFSSLDFALKKRIIDKFKTFWDSDKNHKVCIYVTHDLDETLYFADRLIVLKNGKIALDESIQSDNRVYGENTEQKKNILKVLLEN